MASFAIQRLAERLYALEIDRQPRIAGALAKEVARRQHRRHSQPHRATRYPAEQRRIGPRLEVRRFQRFSTTRPRCPHRGTTTLTHRTELGYLRVQNHVGATVAQSANECRLAVRDRSIDDHSASGQTALRMQVLKAAVRPVPGPDYMPNGCAHRGPGPLDQFCSHGASRILVSYTIWVETNMSTPVPWQRLPPVASVNPNAISSTS